ncbi:uncharacterized protein LOC124913919 [Impatiens glandulifera]|uniref:uncharacterized protein LOC124913919 n=1 Tax=Impatiens glandulifera TaxID=253017 RepID=UPI001FB18DD2|nr:uncharacterized protein LOC124913919 [Impatiens glandulifera]
MEPNNIPVVAKRFWNLVRGVWLVLRKGISKPKLLMLDLNVMVKRGKLAGKNMMHNIISHHHHHHHHASPEPRLPADEYEFSCSDTPAHRASFPFAFHLNNYKRKQHGTGNFFGSCAHAPQTNDQDFDDVIDGELSEALASSPSVAAFLQSPGVSEMMYGCYSEAPSPALPGFGRTPVVRQLRVTDSPFPLGDIEENCLVDAAAEEFIGKFYEQLRKQNGKGRK